MEAMRNLVYSGCRVMERGQADWRWITSLVTGMVAEKKALGVSRMFALAYIGRSQANAGDIEAARRTLAAFYDEVVSPNAVITAIAKAACRKQGPQEACKWVETPPQFGGRVLSPEEQVYGYIGIVDGLMPDDDLLRDPLYFERPE